MIFVMHQNHSVQDIIQKCHFQLHLEALHSKFLEFYLQVMQKIHFYIVFYLSKQKEQQRNILIHMKDMVSRMQLQLEENQDIKNRSFIVAVKKMQSKPKKAKSFQNISVQCDLMKGSSEVGKQLLKLLEEKTFTKKDSQKTNKSKIQEPTKDHFIHQYKQTQKSEIYPSRSQSLQQKVQRMKSSMNIPTSEKKRINQVQVKDTPFMIKRSQTVIGEQLESQQDSPKRQRENNHIIWTGKRVGKPAHRPENNISSFSPQFSQQAINEQNSSSTDQKLKQTALNIANSQKSQAKKNNGLNSIHTDQINESQIVLRGLNISKINSDPVHPFKLNLSSLSNPLILSNKTTQSKILPTSLITSKQQQITSSIKRQSLPSVQQHQIMFKKLSETNTINVNSSQQFSQQSSIPNKHEVSISESDYSDMFESDDDQEEPKLQIKVEAIFENDRQNGLKPRLEICYIQLYSNDQVKFTSMNDKPFFSGKLIKIYKKPQNYYDLIVKQKNEKEQSKNQTEIVKKIKFRGQARPFMKYLEKV